MEEESDGELPEDQGGPPPEDDGGLDRRWRHSREEEEANAALDEPLQDTSCFASPTAMAAVQDSVRRSDMFGFHLEPEQVQLLGRLQDSVAIIQQCKVLFLKRIGLLEGFVTNFRGTAADIREMYTLVAAAKHLRQQDAVFKAHVCSYARQVTDPTSRKAVKNAYECYVQWKGWLKKLHDIYNYHKQEQESQCNTSVSSVPSVIPPIDIDELMESITRKKTAKLDRREHERQCEEEAAALKDQQQQRLRQMNREREEQLSQREPPLAQELQRGMELFFNKYKNNKETRAAARGEGRVRYPRSAERGPSTSWFPTREGSSPTHGPSSTRTLEGQDANATDEGAWNATEERRHSGKAMSIPTQSRSGKATAIQGGDSDLEPSHNSTFHEPEGVRAVGRESEINALKVQLAVYKRKLLDRDREDSERRTEECRRANFEEYEREKGQRLRRTIANRAVSPAGYFDGDEEEEIPNEELPRGVIRQQNSGSSGSQPNSGSSTPFARQHNRVFSSQGNTPRPSSPARPMRWAPPVQPAANAQNYSANAQNNAAYNFNANQFYSSLPGSWAIGPDLGTPVLKSFDITKIEKSDDWTKFDGNAENWPEFRDMFQTVIHRQNIAVAHKVLSLKSSLDKECERLAVLTKGFAADYEGYRNIIEVLENEYGNPDELLNRITDRIFNLPELDFSSYDSVLNTERTVIRGMDLMRQNGLNLETESRTFGQLIYNKMPDKDQQKLLKFCRLRGRQPTFKLTMEFITEKLEDLRAFHSRRAIDSDVESDDSCKEEAILVSRAKAVPTTSKSKTSEAVEKTENKNKTDGNAVGEAEEEWEDEQLREKGGQETC